VSQSHEGPTADLPEGGRRVTTGVVFRSGKQNPGNMTPRPKDAHGPHRGLSAHIRPEGSLPPKPEGEESKTHFVVMIDVSALDLLEAYEHHTGHISFRPRTQEELDSWIASRGEPGIHPLTQEIRNAAIGEQTIGR